jgi:hypothetical protein
MPVTSSLKLISITTHVVPKGTPCMSAFLSFP